MDSLKLLFKIILDSLIFIKKVVEKNHHCLNEASTSVVMERRNNLLSYSSYIAIISFNLYNCFNYFKILSQNLRVLFDFLAIVNATRPGMLEAAVDSVISIKNEIDDIFNIEDIEAVLYLF